MEAKSKNKVLLISDYGRSGQGWLSYMLCYILNAKFIEPYDLSRGSLYSSGLEYVINLTSGDLPGRKKTEYSMVVKTHGFPSDDFKLTNKVVFLTRDPRDVAVSDYFRYLFLYKKAKSKSSKRKLANLIYGFRPANYFITAYNWKKYYKGWEHIKCYPIRYEDLSLNTKNVLRGVLKYLGINAEDSLIDDAVKKFSFERLSGRKKGEENLEDIDFRKGIIGDYKNYFSKLELKIFSIICRKEARKAGYEI